MISQFGIRVLTWNIHGGIGLDGVRDYSRAIDCIASLEADIIALQEVDGRRWQESVTLLDSFRRRLGPHAVCASAIRSKDGDYGQLLLSRWPIVHSVEHDISHPGCEPRRAIEACLQTAAGKLRLVATHLGLKRRERRKQILRLVDIVQNDNCPTVLLGDFNDWSRFQLAGGILELLLPSYTRERTFPSRSPLFRLDRIYCRPAGLLGASRAVKSGRMISDHLPVVADLNVAALR